MVKKKDKLVLDETLSKKLNGCASVADIVKVLGLDASALEHIEAVAPELGISPEAAAQIKADALEAIQRRNEIN
jgi:hypothetical protein